MNYSGPDGTDIPVTVVCTAPGGSTTIHVVRITCGATAPPLNIANPKKAQKIAEWRSAHGTVVIGAGSHPDVVQVSAVQKRGSRWVALRNGRWAKAKNRKAAFAEANGMTSAVTAQRRQQPLSGLPRGRLIVPATATNQADNVATAVKSQFER